eukprot:1835221-Rhodomonas_salina.2
MSAVSRFAKHHSGASLLASASRHADLHPRAPSRHIFTSSHRHIVTSSHRHIFTSRNTALESWL